MLCLQIFNCKFECFKVASKSYFDSLATIHILDHPCKVGNFFFCPFTVQENSFALLGLRPPNYNFNFAEIEWIYNLGFRWTTCILRCMGDLVQHHSLILIIGSIYIFCTVYALALIRSHTNVLVLFQFRNFLKRW